MASHPSDKNKYVARVGHPESVVSQVPKGEGPGAPGSFTTTINYLQDFEVYIFLRGEGYLSQSACWLGLALCLIPIVRRRPAIKCEGANAKWIQ